MAMKLVQDQMYGLGLTIVLCLVQREVLRLIQDDDNKDKVDAILILGNTECDKMGYCWTESNLSNMTSLFQSSTHPSPATQTLLLSTSSLLAQTLFPQTKHQACVGPSQKKM